MSRAIALILPVLMLAVGCTPRGGDRVKPPALSPSVAASAAIEQLDSNKDQALDAKELDAAPGLKVSLKEIDLNGDGKLAADEIQKRLQGYVDSKVGLMSTSFRVTYRGEPIAGATVTLAPEPFLGNTIKPAIGTTSDDGYVTLVSEGADAPGVACGFYRIRISKVENGRELVPEQYNARTTLGLEVFGGMRTTPEVDLR